MKKYIIIYFLFVNLVIIAQKWDNTYGTSNNDENLEDVIESYDNGFLLSGNYYQNKWSNWLIKTDIIGDILWDKIISWENKDIGAGVVDQNSSGEIILARAAYVNSSDHWPLVIKLDSCGNKQWCRVFIDDNYFWGAINDVILFENGDVLALGWLESEEEIDKIFLYYIDSEGNLIWRESYASKNDHPLVMKRMGNSIRKFENEYIISGYCRYPFPGNPNTGYKRPFFIGIDTLFNEKWILPFAINDTILGNAYNVIALNDSVYMGVGYRVMTGFDQFSVFMFFNSDGEELGFNDIPNEVIGPDIEDNATSDIARLNDTLFITSTVFGPDESLATFGEFIIDTAANVYKIESRPNTEGISTLIKTFYDKYVIGCTYEHPNGNEDIYMYKINDSLEMDTVYPGNYTYDSLCPYQIESGIIDITDCLLITDVREVPTPKEYFASLNTVHVKAFPNPVNGNQVTFEFQNTEHLTPPSVPPAGWKPPHLCIYNIFGEKVHEEKVYRFQGESKVDVGDWNSGMYLAIVYSQNKIVGQCKFVVQ